jgi:hypothetical protein
MGGGGFWMYKGTLSGDGRLGPIEERLGRRLLRLVDPESDEGQKLLEQGDVELIGPDGEQLGRMRIEEAYAELIARLERRLTEIADPADQTGLEEGLQRLRRRSERTFSDPG